MLVDIFLVFDLIDIDTLIELQILYSGRGVGSWNPNAMSSDGGMMGQGTGPIQR